MAWNFPSSLVTGSFAGRAIPGILARVRGMPVGHGGCVEHGERSACGWIVVRSVLACVLAAACGTTDLVGDVGTTGDGVADGELDIAQDVTEADTTVYDVPVDGEEDAVEWCAGDMHCAGDEYCEVFSCGMPGGTFGICLAVPVDCPHEWRPACGCDGVTYPNDCRRRQERVSLAYMGECVEDEACGGIAGYMCPDGMMCDTSRPVSSGCGLDMEGVCRPVPGWCPDDILIEVCGCDGATYTNDCLRMMAGVSRESSGACG